MPDELLALEPVPLLPGHGAAGPARSGQGAAGAGGTATGTGSSALMGRAGLVPVFTSATSGKFALGRMYQSSSDTTAVSAWPMNMANLILVGRGYTMDFYGLQYE